MNQPILDPLNPQPGIYDDVSESVYRNAPGICQSDLKEAEISMAHYHQLITSPRKPSTPDQKLGTFTHALILCQRRDFVVIPEDAPRKPIKSQLNARKPSPETVEAIAWWRAFELESGGLEMISREDADRIIGMRDAVMAHPVASEILNRKGHNEVVGFKIHEATGLLLKGRADRICMDNENRMVIPDLKTTQRGGASLESFTRDIFKWGYFRQGDFYLRLFGASFFIFIVIEKEAPYSVAVYCLDRRALDLGYAKNERDLARVKACQDSGVWPGYAESVTTISVPPWVQD